MQIRVKSAKVRESINICTSISSIIDANRLSAIYVPYGQRYYAKEITKMDLTWKSKKRKDTKDIIQTTTNIILQRNLKEYDWSKVWTMRQMTLGVRKLQYLYEMISVWSHSFTLLRCTTSRFTVIKLKLFIKNNTIKYQRQVTASLFFQGYYYLHRQWLNQRQRPFSSILRFTRRSSLALFICYRDFLFKSRQTVRCLAI